VLVRCLSLKRVGEELDHYSGDSYCYSSDSYTTDQYDFFKRIIFALLVYSIPLLYAVFNYAIDFRTSTYLKEHILF